MDERRYQVFVSSTFKDLEAERQAVLQAVLELKAFPAGMELFPSADEEQWEFIRREIESSGYYVVIVAGKYGSFAPDGISFTEKEYDYAVSLGKPVMGFLAKDLDQLKGAQLETDPARRERLNEFRSKVSASRLVRFYDNSHELKAQVMQSLIHAFHFTPQEGWARAKNARRLEDLEEINTLRKRVMELEAEVARMRRPLDATSIFAQGEDPVEWTLTLANSGVVSPPAPDFRLQTSWNELLVVCFETGVPATENEIWWRLEAFAVARIAASIPDAQEWSDRADSRSIVNLIAIEDKIRLQFLAAELIDVQAESLSDGSQRFTWRLTDKGRRQFASLRAILRSNSPAL